MDRLIAKALITSAVSMLLAALGCAQELPKQSRAITSRTSSTSVPASCSPNFVLAEVDPHGRFVRWLANKP